MRYRLPISCTIVAFLAVLIMQAQTDDHAAHAQANQQCMDFTSMNMRVCLSPLGVSATPTAAPAVDVTRTPIPTSTGTPMPTGTVTPSPTTTPHADATLVATPTSVSGNPFPACSHDPTKYHGLVERNSSGAITCSYGHEHRDDPSSVDAIFGAPSAWYGGTQEISYPWQTSNATTGVLENAAKHNGYKWYVRQNLPCVPAGGDPKGCIIAYRTQVHTMGDISDATTRFHSFSLEALVRDPATGREGIVRGGGHMDTGHLFLLTDSGPALCPGISTDPPSFVCGNGDHRALSSTNVPAGSTAHQTDISNWYASHRSIQVGPQLEDWGPIDYQNPTTQQFYPAILDRNNSKGRIENMAIVTINPPFAGMTQGGVVTGMAYVDRNGFPVSGCSAPSVDCVPYKAEHAPSVVAFMSANSTAALGTYSEGDVVDPATGKSLMRFPN